MDSAELRCPQCGRPAGPTERFCSQCGTGLSRIIASDAGTGVFTTATGLTTEDAAQTSAATFPGAALTGGNALTAPPTGQVAMGDDPFAPGRRIGTRYTVIKLLGRGGMGAVYAVIR